MLTEGTLLKTLSRYQGPVIFMYLCEAHAADSWPLSTKAPQNHRTLEERIRAAKAFMQTWPALREVVHNVVVEEMDNALTMSLGLWPERFLDLEDGEVQWASSFKDAEPAQMNRELASELEDALSID